MARLEWEHRWGRQEDARPAITVTPEVKRQKDELRRRLRGYAIKGTVNVRAGKGYPMARFVLGIVIGLILGTIVSIEAAQMVGSNGYLRGWTVVVNDEEICDSPYVWMNTREIGCD